MVIVILKNQLGVFRVTVDHGVQGTAVGPDQVGCDPPCIRARSLGGPYETTGPVLPGDRRLKGMLKPKIKGGRDKVISQLKPWYILINQ